MAAFRRVSKQKQIIGSATFGLGTDKVDDAGLQDEIARLSEMMEELKNMFAFFFILNDETKNNSSLGQKLTYIFFQW